MLSWLAVLMYLVLALGALLGLAIAAVNGGPTAAIAYLIFVGCLAPMVFPHRALRRR